MLQKQLYKQGYFECETKGEISQSILQNWTRQAYDCYKIKCDCKKCNITKMGYSFKCKMKNVVEILLKTKGLPDERVILENHLKEAAENS